MKTRICSMLLTAALTVGILTAPASASCVGGATLTTDLRLRAGAGTDTETLAVGRGSECVIVEADAGDGWYRVNYKGREGYMFGEYLTLSDTLTADFGSGVIQGMYVRLREGPGTDTAILTTYNTGTGVTVTGVSGNWYQVRIGERTGYVHSDYLSVGPAAESGPANGGSQARTVPSGESAQDVVTTALGYLGCPYVYGGTSPYGFDCSGFVQYVYGLHGITLDRTAAQQCANNGAWVSYEDLQPGDLLYFGNYGYVGHAGLYIGDGQFIHAESANTGVVISRLDGSYYANCFVCGKRVL